MIIPQCMNTKRNNNIAVQSNKVEEKSKNKKKNMLQLQLDDVLTANMFSSVSVFVVLNIYVSNVGVHATPHQPSGLNNLNTFLHVK